MQSQLKTCYSDAEFILAKTVSITYWQLFRFSEAQQTACEIYKKVGTMFKVSAGSVERSIRTCLTEAFYINSFVFLNRFFKMDIFTRETYLVNGDFISIVSTYLDVIDAPDIEFILINDPKE